MIVSTAVKTEVEASVIPAEALIVTPVAAAAVTSEEEAVPDVLITNPVTVAPAPAPAALSRPTLPSIPSRFAVTEPTDAVVTVRSA